MHSERDGQRGSQADQNGGGEPPGAPPRPVAGEGELSDSEPDVQGGSRDQKTLQAEYRHEDQPGQSCSGNRPDRIDRVDASDDWFPCARAQ